MHTFCIENMSFKIMKDPVAYVRHNKLQLRDNYNILRDNIKRIHWKGGDRIIDIGSGDGGCTARILKSFLPEDYKELVGVDRNEEMVRYANENHGGDRVSFNVLELGGDMKQEIIGRFDHAFSFYTIQLVRDLKKGFRQIYDMLTPGGDCLLSMVCGSSVFHAMYDHFSKSQKWSKWFKAGDQFFCPYYNCPNVEEEATQHMSEAGFKDVHVEFLQLRYNYGSADDFKLAIRAITFIPIPEELFDEYLDEHVQGALERGFIDEDYTLKYELVKLYGRK